MSTPILYAAELHMARRAANGDAEEFRKRVAQLEAEVNTKLEAVAQAVLESATGAAPLLAGYVGPILGRTDGGAAPKLARVLEDPVRLDQADLVAPVMREMHEHHERGHKRRRFGLDREDTRHLMSDTLMRLILEHDAEQCAAVYVRAQRRGVRFFTRAVDVAELARNAAAYGRARVLQTVLVYASLRSAQRFALAAECRQMWGGAPQDLPDVVPLLGEEAQLVRLATMTMANTSKRSSPFLDAVVQIVLHHFGALRTRRFKALCPRAVPQGWVEEESAEERRRRRRRRHRRAHAWEKGGDDDEEEEEEEEPGKKRPKA